MSIYRYKGNWKAEVWLNKKRFASKSGFSTKAEAREWHDDHIVKFRTKPQGPAHNSTTFDDLLGRFKKNHLPTVSPGTRRRYRIEIEQRIEGFFRYRKLQDINSMVIESYRGEILNQLTPKSVNISLGLLGTIFRKGVEWGMIDLSPVRLRPLRLPQQKYQWWDNKEHISSFLKEAAKSRHYATYKLALECGMRIGEIVGLSKQDVDLKRCQIHIHRQWLDKENTFGPPKGRRERFINFNPTSGLKEALEDAMNRSSDPETLFMTEIGTRLRCRRIAEDHFPRLVKRSQVPRIRFHDLRHTFASWYMLEYDDIWSLKGILGHVDVQTTQRYAHLSKKHQRIGALSWSVN